jgi:recombination protein RecA
MKFYATLRFDMRKIAPLKDSMGEFIGHRCRVKLVKNKVAPPFQIAEFDMMYGFGIVPELDLIDCALETEVFTKKGAWIAFGEEMVGQGRVAAAETLASNETLGLAVKTKVMETYANAGEEVEKSVEVSVGTDGVVEPAQAGAGSPQG